MDIMPLQFYSAIGAIVAALIGGFLSLLSLTTSKDQKISELRDQWITDFRNELSALIAEILWSEFWATQFKDDPANSAKNPWVEDAYKSSYLSITKCASSIRLRVNPKIKDPQLRALNQQFLEKLDELSGAWHELTLERASALTTELRKRAALILQAEWQHIERGGLGHRVLRGAAVVVLVLGLLGVVGVGLRLAHLTSPSAIGTPATAPRTSSQPGPDVKGISR